MAGDHETRPRSEAIAARFEVPVFVAALAVIPALVLEQGTDDGTLRLVAAALNWASWLVFAAEIGVMLAVTPNRRAWARAHALDIVITVVTFPVALSALQALRAVRLVRLLRTARLLRLLRAAQISDRWFSPAGLGWSAFIALLSVLAAGQAFTLVEDEQSLSMWDGLWWAVTTSTTVGYGDIYPATTAGRMIALGLMFVGIGFVAMLTAAVAQRFVLRSAESSAPEAEEHGRLLAELIAIRERLERIEAAQRASGGAPGPPGIVDEPRHASGLRGTGPGHRAQHTPASGVGAPAGVRRPPGGAVPNRADSPIPTA